MHRIFSLLHLVIKWSIYVIPSSLHTKQVFYQIVYGYSTVEQENVQSGNIVNNAAATANSTATVGDTPNANTDNGATAGIAPAAVDSTPDTMHMANAARIGTLPDGVANNAGPVAGLVATAGATANHTANVGTISISWLFKNTLL